MERGEQLHEWGPPKARGVARASWPRGRRGQRIHACSRGVAGEHRPRSEGCIYINDYSNAKREAYISERAGQQEQYGFSFAYPVFFPTCLPTPTSNPNDIVAFDSIGDADMLKTIESLMQKYN